MAEQAEVNLGTCLVCLRHQSSVAFVPCGHIAVCNRCLPLFVASRDAGPRYTVCLACNNRIASCLRVFAVGAAFTAPDSDSASGEDGGADQAPEPGPQEVEDPLEDADIGRPEQFWLPGEYARAEAWMAAHQFADIRIYAVWKVGMRQIQGVYFGIGNSAYDYLRGLAAWRDLRFRRARTLDNAGFVYHAEAHRHGAPQLATAFFH